MRAYTRTYVLVHTCLANGGAFRAIDRASSDQHQLNEEEVGTFFFISNKVMASAAAEEEAVVLYVPASLRSF